MRQTTPLGIVTAESALPLERALLDHRQAQLALRLMVRPRGRRGQEEILERTSDLTARIRERCILSRRETVEVQSWEEFRSLRGRVLVESKEGALRMAREWQDLSGTVPTGGSRLESGRMRAELAFWENSRWARRGTYLGTDKEVFDVEVFAILRATQLLNERGKSEQSYTVFSDSQAAISRIQHDRCGPA